MSSFKLKIFGLKQNFHFKSGDTIIDYCIAGKEPFNRTIGLRQPHSEETLNLIFAWFNQLPHCMGSPAFETTDIILRPISI